MRTAVRYELGVDFVAPLLNLLSPLNATLARGTDVGGSRLGDTRHGVARGESYVRQVRMPASPRGRPGPQVRQGRGLGFPQVGTVRCEDRVQGEFKEQVTHEHPATM